jgi:uncharacterized membrane protein HdeD (DUF308 family)
MGILLFPFFILFLIPFIIGLFYFTLGIKTIVTGIKEQNRVKKINGFYGTLSGTILMLAIYLTWYWMFNGWFPW